MKLSKMKVFKKKFNNKQMDGNNNIFKGVNDTMRKSLDKSHETKSVQDKDTHMIWLNLVLGLFTLKVLIWLSRTIDIKLQWYAQHWLVWLLLTLLIMLHTVIKRHTNCVLAIVALGIIGEFAIYPCVELVKTTTRSVYLPNKQAVYEQEKIYETILYMPMQPNQKQPQLELDRIQTSPYDTNMINLKKSTSDFQLDANRYQDSNLKIASMTDNDTNTMLNLNHDVLEKEVIRRKHKHQPRNHNKQRTSIDLATNLIETDTTVSDDQWKSEDRYNSLLNLLTKVTSGKRMLNRRWVVNSDPLLEVDSADDLTSENNNQDERQQDQYNDQSSDDQVISRVVEFSESTAEAALSSTTEMATTTNLENALQAEQEKESKNNVGSEKTGENSSKNATEPCKKLEEKSLTMYKKIVIFLYIVVFVLGVIGNSVVIYAVFRKGKLTTMDIFILNMSACDLMLCVFAIPVTPIYTIYYEYWPYDLFLCKMFAFAQCASVYIVTLTMIDIAYVRHRSIVYPHKTPISTSIAICMALSSWVVASLVTMPYTDHIGLHPQNCDVKFCSEKWEDSWISQFWFGVFTMVMQFLVPFLCLSYLYGTIFIKIRDQQMKQQTLQNWTIKGSRIRIKKKKYHFSRRKPQRRSSLPNDFNDQNQQPQQLESEQGTKKINHQDKVTSSIGLEKASKTISDGDDGLLSHKCVNFSVFVDDVSKSTTTYKTSTPDDKSMNTEPSVSELRCNRDGKQVCMSENNSCRFTSTDCNRHPTVESSWASNYADNEHAEGSVKCVMCASDLCELSQPLDKFEQQDTSEMVTESAKIQMHDNDCSSNTQASVKISSAPGSCTLDRVVLGKTRAQPAQVSTSSINQKQVQHQQAANDEEITSLKLLKISKKFINLKREKSLSKMVSVRIDESKDVLAIRERKQREKEKRARDLNRKLICMVLLFGFSWLPLDLFNIAQDSWDLFSSWEYLDDTYYLVHLLTCSSVCYNPILYAMLSDNYRSELKNLLPKCLFTSWSTSNSR